MLKHSYTKGKGMSIFLGEFLGTLLLVLLGNGAVANVLLTQSKGNGGGWIVISAGWGFAVAIAVYATGWVSGSHLNPAVTIGLIASGNSLLADCPIYFLGQMVGAMVGAILVWFAYQPHFAVTKAQDLKLMCFCTKPAIRNTIANVTTEVIATAVLMVGILALIDKHNNIGLGFGPFLVGILVYSIGLSLGGPTGYAINPARDLGPRIMHALLPIAGKGSSEWRYAWIPVVGPICGALIGANIYMWIVAQVVAA